MALIEPLDWDSSFFEIRIGRVIIQDENNFDPIRFCEEAKSRFDLVYVFSFQKMLSYEKVLKGKLDLVDIMLTMSMPFDRQEYLEGTFNIRNFLSEQELSACYQIAEQTSAVSRFHKEPLIGPEKTKALYRKWVDNALDKSYCDGIILHNNNKYIDGIHIIKTDLREKIGYCSVIGVDNNTRNANIGKNLWEQALRYWAIQRNILKCKVSFSIKNIVSFNFHLKVGFNKIEEVKYIYHYRTKNKQ